jgi:hypothetical protein
MLGLGAGGIWLAVMFISIFTPVMVTGTAPWITEVPLASILSVIAGLILTWLLCRTVKTAYFQPAEPPPVPAATTPTVGPEDAADDVVTKLRRPGLAWAALLSQATGSPALSQESARGSCSGCHPDLVPQS